jgi:hypothetical protein
LNTVEEDVEAVEAVEAAGEGEVPLLGAADAAAVRWAADVRVRKVQECGFGISIGGQLMQEGR